MKVAKCFPASSGRTSCFLIACALLAGCVVGPDFSRPVPPSIAAYTHETLPPETVAADNEAQHFQMQQQLSAQWWHLFHSKNVDAIVTAAIMNNPTLQAAEARLRQSQQSLRAGYGVFYPQIDMQSSEFQQRAAVVQQGKSSGGSVFNVATISGRVSYTLDIFGANRRHVEGLRAQTDYQRYVRQAAYVALTANVVDTCIARAAYLAELDAIDLLIAGESEQLAATAAQVRAGTQPYASLLSMRSEIATSRGTQATLRQKLNQTEHLLAQLMGKAPTQASLPDIALQDLTLPRELPVSLPSVLVRQRPDILSSEAQLHEASANVGVATAAMFPSFSLTGTYGLARTSLDNLAPGTGSFWSVGPVVTLPLFQGGSLWFGRQAAREAYQASLADYRQVVLGSFVQVADALKALEHDAQSVAAAAEAKQAAAEALGLLQVNYRAGLAAYPEVLVADVQYRTALITYVQTEAVRYQDTVTLFAALGGGWGSETQQNEVPSP